MSFQSYTMEVNASTQKKNPNQTINKNQARTRDLPNQMSDENQDTLAKHNKSPILTKASCTNTNIIPPPPKKKKTRQKGTCRMKSDVSSKIALTAEKRWLAKRNMAKICRELKDQKLT